MRRQETTLTVFVASPGDVQEERDRVDDAVNEIDTTWGRAESIRLEVIRWETHAVPGLGADAQEVVNQSIPDDYDIFLGVMWHRLGTPTLRAPSGTLEEFQRAKARFDKDPRSVRVLFYFKDAPVSPSKMDGTQLQKVAEFSRELGVAGALHWSFSDAAEFEKLIRIHLQRILKDWSGNGFVGTTSLAPRESSSVPSTHEMGIEDDEPGLIDLIMTFTDSFESASVGMASTNALTETITLVMSKAGEDLTATKIDGNSNYREAKRIITALAADLDRFNTEFGEAASVTLSNLEIGIEALIKFIQMHSTVDASDIAAATGLLEQLDTMQEAIKAYTNQLTVSDRAILQWPRMTREINVARRRLHLTIDDVVTRYGQSENLVQEVRKAILALVKRATSAAETEQGFLSLTRI